MASVQIEDAAFQAGLREALADFDRQAERIVDEVGEKVVALARGFAPRGATGDLAASIGAEPGRTEKGPYVDVGTSLYYGFYQEMGTYKMKAHPFMRPALAQVGAMIRAAGAAVSLRGTKGTTALRKRATARQQLRRAAKRGKITTGQARAGSRAISNLKAGGLRLRRLRIF